MGDRCTSAPESERAGSPGIGRRVGAVLFCLAIAGSCAGGHERSRGSENIALGHAVQLVGVSGDKAVATDGRLRAEGAPRDEGTVVLAGPASALVIDLGAVKPLAALLLQAGAADIYFVEASTDGSSWGVVWRVEPRGGGTGLRTQRTSLGRPVQARWLRVRATTANLPAVAEVQAFAAEPASWPTLQLSRPDSRLPLWPALTREKVLALQGALAAAFMLSVGWSALARRGSTGEQGARARRGLLVAVAGLSLFAWTNFLNFHYYGFVHTWEFFHYYLGAKYLPELGYTRLYACAAAADREDGIDPQGQVMRDLRNYELILIETQHNRLDECPSRFSRERWEMFRRDARFFREAMGTDAWMAVRRDHGFNASPVWAVAGSALASVAPASWPQITRLAGLDIALVAGALVILGRAFGLEIACIAAGYFGLNTLAPFGWTGGSFLRYDWLFLLVAGMVSLRMQRPVLAGFALGWSALLRVFPVCAIAGLALKVLLQAADERSLAPVRRQGRFAAGALGAVVLFGGASALMTRQPGLWREFTANSAKHLGVQATNMVGLKTFLAYRRDTRAELMADPLLLDRHAEWHARLKGAEREASPAQLVAGGAYVLLLALAVRGRPDWVAATLGLGLMPMLLKLSSYYYVAFMAVAALSAVSPGTGFTLASFTWATNIALGLWPAPDELHAWLSLAAVLLAVVVAGSFAWRRASAPD